MGNFETVAGTHAGPADEVEVIGIRIVKPNTIHEEQGLIGVCSPHENGGDGTRSTRSKVRGSRDGIQCTGQGINLATLEISGGNPIDGRAKLGPKYGSAGRRGYDGFKLRDRGLSGQRDAESRSNQN